jgi:hypothetical protein
MFHNLAINSPSYAPEKRLNQSWDLTKKPDGRKENITWPFKPLETFETPNLLI